MLEGHVPWPRSSRPDCRFRASRGRAWWSPPCSLLGRVTVVVLAAGAGGAGAGVSLFPGC